MVGEVPLPLTPLTSVMQQFFGSAEPIFLCGRCFFESLIPGTRSSHSKVTELNFKVLVDEDVSRLQISVHDVGRVDEVQAAEEVVEQPDHILLIERQIFPLHAIQEMPEVGVCKFED